MFTLDELRESLADPRLIEDFAHVRRGLATYRLDQDTLLDPERTDRLHRVVEAVLASAPDWPRGEGADVLLRAAEAAEVLSLSSESGPSGRAALRTALLYELAGLPMMAAAAGFGEGLPILEHFFKRKGAFGSLAMEVRPVNGAAPRAERLVALAASEDALGLARFEHGENVEVAANEASLREAAARLEAGMSVTDVVAFSEVVRRRARLATREHAPRDLLGALTGIGFPPELWNAQAEALDGGILDPAHDAWGFAAPTGTGKTFLSRLVILNALAERPQSRVLYLVPTRALVRQVSLDLSRSLKEAAVEVAAVTPQLAALEAEEEEAIAGAKVLVLTPEKADMLLRIGASFLGQVSLVMVDEAHHLEDGTRGVLLELYLARLRGALADSARYILLSAVAPNIREVTEWVGQNPGSVVLDDRSTRMKVGVYKVEKLGGRNRGLIDYMDGTQIRLFDRGLESSALRRLAQLAERIGPGGPVLLIAEGPGRAETVAKTLRDRLEAAAESSLLSEEELASPTMERLDSRLEREMYAAVPLRKMVRHRVAYHHAGLPPRVREALEDAIKEGFIHYVVATTTLADGVNFPFSTVVVETLAIREPTFEVGVRPTYRAVTPRTFWNIAGRAGRPGYDHEGQVILFDPALRIEHAGGSIEPYTNPSIIDIPPVRSALASGLSEIYDEVSEGDLDPEALGDAEESDELPRKAQGIVNLLRVGLAHAKATGVDRGADEYFADTFAARQMPAAEREFAKRVLRQQEAVLDGYLEGRNAASVRLVAELGLSISTMSRLRGYVRDLEDWQLERIDGVVRGGRINFDQLRYILGPVLARMAELEGKSLSGWYSDMVADWCRGKPFAEIRRTEREDKLEDLIRLMYSRIQYILPWGLYAMDRFIEEEAAERGVEYGNQVNLLAYLVDAGVPDLAALTLTRAGFERTDAARLARDYWGSPAARETTDISAWLKAQPYERLVAVVRGVDHRPLDFDFENLVERTGPSRAD
ncbi:MAG: DEAD/DEAH box helicase [Actinobacteria bacterium]|nr:DEAD/DEAH box helicase [Actinomycetota bacterium]